MSLFTKIRFYGSCHYWWHFLKEKRLFLIKNISILKKYYLFKKLVSLKELFTRTALFLPLSKMIRFKWISRSLFLETKILYDFAVSNFLKLCFQCLKSSKNNLKKKWDKYWNLKLDYSFSKIGCSILFIIWLLFYTYRVWSNLFSLKTQKY